MRQAALSLATMGLALPLFAAVPAQAQAPRTWVSGAGSDANPCSRTAPCRTFDGALQGGKTAAGGEINCLDASDFGPVNITTSLTISCEAGTAGILAPNSIIAVGINAATTDVVTLRGLDIDGQGTGGNGIGIAMAKAVHIEKCTIRNFRGNAAASGIITFTNFSFTVFMFVSDTVISGNLHGVIFGNTGGFKVASLKNVTITGSTNNGLNLFPPNIFVNVTKSVISGNGGSAVTVFGSGSTVNIDRSTIANNGTGLTSGGSGSVIRASGNNIFNNTTGFVIGVGATIQSDGSNNTGGSNGGVAAPNAPLTKN